MGTHDCMSEREALAYVAHRVAGMQCRATANGYATGGELSAFERGKAHALACVAVLLASVREDFER
jgi:phage-related minor tail protein